MRGISPAALLTNSAWRRLFAADASVGRTSGGSSTTIQSSSRGSWRQTTRSDRMAKYTLPIDESTAAFLDRTIAMGYGAIGRLQPGAAPSVANAQLQATAARIAQAHPEGRTGHSDLPGGSGRTVLGPANWRPCPLLPRRGDCRAAPECRQRRDAAPRTRGPAHARVRVARRPRWRSQRARAPASRRGCGDRYSGRRPRDSGRGVGAEAVHLGAAVRLPRPRVHDPDRRPRHVLHARRVGNDDDRLRDGAAAGGAADRSHAGAWRRWAHRRIDRRGPHPSGAARGAAGAHRRAALWRGPVPQEFRRAHPRAARLRSGERPGDPGDAQRASVHHRRSDSPLRVRPDRSCRRDARGPRRRDRQHLAAWQRATHRVRPRRWAHAIAERRAARDCSRGQSVVFPHAGHPRHSRPRVSGDGRRGRSTRRDRQPVAGRPGVSRGGCHQQDDQRASRPREFDQSSRPGPDRLGRVAHQRGRDQRDRFPGRVRADSRRCRRRRSSWSRERTCRPRRS